MSKNTKKLNFYTLDKIKEKHAQYNIIFGERSNGKTFAVLKEGIKQFIADGSEMAIIRRYHEDFVGANSAKTCFNSLARDAYGVNQIAELTGGKYDGVSFYNGVYYFTAPDPSKNISTRTDTIIARGFSLSSGEHYKSASFPLIKTVFLDEFMTRGYYLTDEFVIYQNLLSTLIRHRDDITIYMCANTVNKYACPYFTEMGLYRIKQMQQGDIDVYTYGDSGLKVAVEWSDGIAKKKPSDVYFAFNNPRLQMITKGSWEIDIYPHCPHKYAPKDILLKYFIVFDREVLQCEIVYVDNMTFTFIHRKTSPLKDLDTDIIYTTDYDPRPNYKRRITAPASPVEQRIAQYYREERVYYQDNEVGEIVRNYLQWCRSA